jgi:ribosomal protein L25 (general stress protein Ctc)
LERISIKLSRLRYGAKNKMKMPQLNAYACIYGAGEESAKLQFRHLELINPLRKKNEYEKPQPQIGEYLRWLGAVKRNDHKVFSIKV